MIRPLTENDVDLFIKIRGDSLRLDPKSFRCNAQCGYRSRTDDIDLKNKSEENFILGFFASNNLLEFLVLSAIQNAKNTAQRIYLESLCI